ncbi:hypothetical protein [Salinisphaera orenii]|uniref:hypothetical protein n=1 Tax=Salinisphaera orenii TaxID=856731 RepID=UPI0013A63C73
MAKVQDDQVRFQKATVMLEDLETTNTEVAEHSIVYRVTLNGQLKRHGCFENPVAKAAIANSQGVE